jgi:predicted dehydrogenase
MTSPTCRSPCQRDRQARETVRTRQTTSKTAVSRRRFLATAAALAAPALAPASALGLGGAAPPSERIGLGFIGVGGRGMSHVGSLLRNGQTQILGVCDPYLEKREAARKQVESHYGRTRAAGGDYRGCASSSDFRDLLARDDIDAVVIASPENWHALHMALAARAGKDVYGEKALSLTVAESRAVCDTVRRYGRVFQTGTQQRSDRKFRFACELARNGYLGKVRAVEVGVPGGRALPNPPVVPVPPGLDYDMWLGPAPFKPYNDLQCTFNWYFIYDYCVGWIQSWGVHHIDIALWGVPGLGTLPLDVEGSAVFPTDGLANTSITWCVQCTAADGVRLSFSDNGHHEQGCRFLGDEGWVHVNRGGIRAQPESLLQVAIKPHEEHLYASGNHHANFLECVRSRRDPVAPVEAGHAATTLTIVSDIATRLGRKVTWDWQSERFTGDDDANRMLSRSMRSPWSL